MDCTNELGEFLDSKKEPPRRMKIQILEVGYCIEWHWENKKREICTNS